ncbi:hypothetical protein NJI34_06380, partial [Pseudomonas sp. S 311-6]
MRDPRIYKDRITDCQHILAPLTYLIAPKHPHRPGQDIDKLLCLMPFVHRRFVGRGKQWRSPEHHEILVGRRFHYVPVEIRGFALHPFQPVEADLPTADFHMVLKETPNKLLIIRKWTAWERRKARFQTLIIG